MLPPAEHETIKFPCVFSHFVWNPCLKKKKRHGLKRFYSFLKEPASEDMKLKCHEDSW